MAKAAGKGRRPSVRIRFRYDAATGEIQHFIVDDQAADRSESYHDEVAAAIAGQLGRRPDIEDAGPRHLLDDERRIEPEEAAVKENGAAPETLEE